MVLVALIGYFALLVLLLVVSFYWISSARRDIERQEREGLEAWVRDTEEAMNTLDLYIYDIYANNRDFLNLSGLNSDTENYESAYNLREAMTSKVLLEADMHGFAISYDRLSRLWYRSKDDSVISTDEMRVITAEFMRRVNMGSYLRNWFPIDVDGKTVLMVMCRRDSAAVAAVHSLADMEASVNAGLKQPGQVALLSPGVGALPGSELTEALGLESRLPVDANRYEARLRGYRVYAQRIPKADVWAVLAVKIDLWSSLNVGQVLLLLLTAASLCAILVMVRFFQQEYLRPMRELKRVMEQIRAGEITEVPAIDARFQEIRDINRTLGSMVAEIEAQKLQIYEEIIERQRAQTQFLQLQLRPHFFLNILKTINALAINREFEQIQDMIYSISTHLRYLFRENQVVSLREELDFVRNYLEMQRHINGREARLELYADERVLDWAVPLLCVQTFVENSVKYARPRGDSMCITVRADELDTETGSYIDLIVSDNCQGYSGDILDRLNALSFGDDGRAVGIGNLLRRCRLLYGERAEFRFYNEDGAVSELILPKTDDGEGAKA